MKRKEGRPEDMARRKRKLRRSHSQESSPSLQSSRNSRENSAPPSFSFFDPKEHYQLLQIGQRKWKKGPVTETIYKVQSNLFQEPDQDLQLSLLRAKEVLKSAMGEIITSAPASSIAQVHLVNSQLNLGVFSSKRGAPNEIDLDQLFARLANAIQSDEHVKLQDTKFHLTVASDKAKIGYQAPGVRSRGQFSLHSYAKAKNCTYDPMNKRNRIPEGCKHMCIPLIIARELFHMTTGTARNSTAGREFLRSIVGWEAATEISMKAGFNTGEAIALDKLHLLAQALPSHVAVNFYDGAGQQPFCVVGNKGSQHNINIFIVFNETELGFSETEFHAYGIVSMPAFLGTRMWCCKCYRGYKSDPHKCSESGCKLCSDPTCSNTSTTKTSLRHLCFNCNFNFYTKDCLQSHKSSCGGKRRCKDCGEVSKKYEKHDCGKPLCHICNIFHSPFEYCYVQKDKPKPKKKRSIWYADTETMVDPTSGEHQVNLLVLQKDSAPADSFLVYNTLTAMKDFTKECMSPTSQFKNATIVFHNASGFDAHLWWKELVKAKAEPRNIIRRRQKILGFELAQNSIKCRDSLQFIPGTPLSAFPKMFGLETGPKGDFPHGLNTTKWIKFNKNIIYREEINGIVHRFPAIKYFWPEKKRPKQLKELKAWHQEMVNQFEENPDWEYCPEKELIAYCMKDVLILRQGFTKYRKTWLEQYPDQEPLDSLTGPSYINKIFRNKHMVEKSLCALPPLGYYPKNLGFSSEALAWIGWMERKLGLTQVRTARKGYEVKLGGHHVDGTGVDAQGQRHVLNFHGCFWHGHHCSLVKKRNQEMDARAENTVTTDFKLQELGDTGYPYGHFIYHRITQCELEKLRSEDPVLNSFISDYIQQLKPTMEPPEEASEEEKKRRGPLKPREALRGGRTEVIKHRIRQIKEGWILYYLDFTSLYPSVNFGLNGEEWPTGHPIIYIGKDLDPDGGLNPPNFTEWFGLAKVVVLPPRQLKIPVLGERVNERLLFHLCSACSKMKHQGYCTHTDEERAIHGTFFTGELQLAIEHGYQLLHTHELWHWPKEQRSTDLFRSLLRDQLGKKIKSSAPPTDPQELQELIQDCYDRLGISLSPEDFMGNPSVRSNSKFAINNIWGFHGKHNDMEQTEVVTTYPRLLQLENDKENQLQAIQVTEDEDYLLVTSKPVKEQASRTGNIVLAVLTASYARMALYNVLSKYPDQVVYMDTDSVFLYLPPSMKPPPTYSFVGHLKDEVKDKYGPGARITKFGSIGPKSYTYQVTLADGSQTTSELKMKGVAFTMDAAHKLTSDAMFHLVDNPNDSVIVDQHVIRKNFMIQSIWNSMLCKEIRRNSDKRWLIPSETMDTLPYGFCF